MTLIDKIKAFESAPVQSVAEFNRLFTESPILGFSQDSLVEIGEIVTPETARQITITGTAVLRHEFSNNGNFGMYKNFGGTDEF